MFMGELLRQMTSYFTVNPVWKVRVATRHCDSPPNLSNKKNINQFASLKDFNNFK